MEKNSSSQEIVESEKEGQEEVEEVEVEVEEEEEEEEYVLLDLDSISDHIRIPPNAPYVLSGLDTVNPILMIDNKIKLVRQGLYKLYCSLGARLQIGEYEETIGTCLVFNESDGDPIVHEEEGGPSEAKQISAKKVNPMARLNKVLKFRLFVEADSEDRADKPS